METLSQGIDFEDMISVGMLAFVNAIKQYRLERGKFIPFARICIQSRVLDEIRKDKPGKLKTVLLVSGTSDDGDDYQDKSLAASAVYQYNRDLERQALAEEIETLRQELSIHSIHFDDLTKISPKQKRSRQLCLSAARQVLSDDSMLVNFQQSSRLATTSLATSLGVSVKP